MIDWDRLREIRADIGEEDFDDVALLFVAEISEHVDRLTVAPATASAADFHFLRGSAANLGFRGLASACAAAEDACRDGGAPDLAGIQCIFRESLNLVVAEVPALAEAA